MPLNDADVCQAGEWLDSANRVLIVCHIRPDGDAIGSLLGLGLALEDAGKQVQMVSEDGVPHSYSSLVGANKVLRKPDGDFDRIVVVDSSDADRVGEVLVGRPVPDIGIDHHITNTAYARLNMIDVNSVATAEIIARLLPAWGMPLTPPIASALMTGLIMDTIGFRTSNMTSEALRLAADLMDAGANLPELYRRALTDRTYEAVRLWAAGLARLERSDRLIWTELTLEDRRAARYPGRDDADLVNILSAVEGADIAVIFIEQPNGRVKVSWRAQPGFDVSQIALALGGGGHAAAAGAELSGNLTDIRDSVLELTRPLLNGGHRVQS